MFDNYFFKELKRRNVIRAGIAYLVVAWLFLQVASIVLPIFEAPPWMMKIFLFFLIIGLPLWLAFVWVYEMTAQGYKKTTDVKPEDSITPKTGQRLNRFIIIGLSLLIVILLIDRVIISRNNELSVTNESAETTNSEFITLATIPFSNISGDESADYFGFALADQVINSLSYLKNIVVRPSSTVRKYQDEAVDPLKAGQDLEVTHILMGHYLKNEDSLRLNVELIDVEENQLLWTWSIKESMEDAFRLQDIVAGKVIEGLEIQFTQGERNRMKKDIPNDPLAYEYYLQAIAYPSTVEGYQNAISMIEKSIQLDSNFAPAYNQLGKRTHLLARYALPEDQDEKIQEAIQAYEKALDINEELLSVLGNLAMIYTESDEKGKAVQMARKAIEINPNHAMAHFTLSYIYRYVGLIDKAVKEVEIAISIDPKNKNFRSGGLVYLMEGRYRKALDAFVLDPSSPYTKGWKGLTQIKLGQFEEAKENLNQAIQLEPEGVMGHWARGLKAYLEDDYEKGISAMNQIVASLEDSESIFHFAAVYALLEDGETALNLLERAVDKGYFSVPYFENDPFLDSIRDDPKFIRIVAKAKRKSNEFKDKFF